MQEIHSFEYAIIRVVPKVEREEFINVGVILYCHTHKFLHVLMNLDDKKLNALSDKTNVEDLKDHLRAFEEICTGDNKSSPIARMDIASRFRWLTAARSTIVQTSRVHPGICSEPQDIIKKLLGEYVL